MHDPTHPDTEQLDRLRCGLLDDEPRLRASLNKHMTSCPDCMARFSSWDQLHQMTGKTDMTEQQLKRDLGSARQAALAISRSERPHQRVPLAVAAALFIALSAGLLTLQYDGSGFIPEDGNAHLVTQTGNDIPDVYEDLDFYLWLATQEESDSTNGGTSANST